MPPVEGLSWCLSVVRVRRAAGKERRPEQGKAECSGLELRGPSVWGSWKKVSMLGK